MDNEDLEDIKVVLDNLLVQTALMLAKQTALIQMVHGVYSETLPKENADLILQNFADFVEKYSNDALDDLGEALFDEAIILRQRFALLGTIQQLRILH